MDKDEDFNLSEDGRFWLRKGGIYLNKLGGGIQIAFRVDMTHHALGSQTGFDFVALGDQIIGEEVNRLHNENRWDCLLYEWDGAKFEQVDPKEQKWFKC